MKKIIRYIFILLCLGVMAYSAWNIYTINDEYDEVDEVYEELAEKFIVIEEANDTDPGGMKKEETTQAEVKISFEELVQQYPDVIGWLYCEDTPINYPIVQSKDNDYYLRRMINGKYNVGGTIFMDYRNSSDFTDSNTIIYGHNMKNGSMFGAIPKYKKQSFLESHPTMTLRTPDKNYTLQVLGGIQTVDSDDIYSYPQTIEKRDEMLNRIGVKLNETDRIIALSTCTYETEDARYILVCKLVEDC